MGSDITLDIFFEIFKIIKLIGVALFAETVILCMSSGFIGKFKMKLKKNNQIGIYFRFMNLFEIKNAFVYCQTAFLYREK